MNPKFRLPILLSSLMCLGATCVSAATIAEYTSQWTTIGESIYFGQGILVPSTSNYLLDSFAFYDMSTNRVGSGTLYLLDAGYTGNVANLSEVSLCSATWNASTQWWDFSSVDDASRTLLAGQTYYLYAANANFGAAESYMAYPASIMYFGYGGSYESHELTDMAFIALGTEVAPVPEPSAVAALAGLSALGIAVLARKRAIKK